MLVRVSHISVYRWIRYFTLFFRTIAHFLLQKVDLRSDKWRLDKTYIKIKGQQHYLGYYWILKQGL